MHVMSDVTLHDIRDMTPLTVEDIDLEFVTSAKTIREF